MAIYRYKAVDAGGKVVDGEMDAVDRTSVIGELQARGQLPIRAELKRATTQSTAMLGRLRRIRQRPRASDVTSFTRELATLLRAGVPIDGALRLLLRHGEHGRLHDVIKQAQDDVRSGKSLSSALAIHGDVFGPLYVSLIRAGESSGALETVLAGLAAHREKSDAFRASLVNALTYPAILVLVAGVSLVVLMSFVVPRFIPLFSEAEQTLPLLTQAVFAVSTAFAAYWWVAVAALALTKVAFDRCSTTAVNQRRLAEWILRAPLIGELARQVDTVRFCRTLATLMKNGLPLVSSLKLTSAVVRNEAIRAMVGRCTEAVRSGRLLSQSLRHESLLPSLAVELVVIGEESGTLEDMLERAADTFETRVEQRLKRLITALEPVLILGLGALIGLVIVAILMAMLGLNDLVI